MEGTTMGRLARRDAAAGRGFTLVELSVVVAMIALLAAVMTPALLRSKLCANESAAIGALRTLASAETQFRQAAAVDQDMDGTGEYGFLGELSGASPLRVDGGLGGAAFSPPAVPTELGTVRQGSAQRSGYEFRVYLPTYAGQAVHQAAAVPAGDRSDGNLQEERWCCYAWPSARAQTGGRAFCVSDAGEILVTDNRAQSYEGTTKAPAPEAAYDPAGADPDNLDAPRVAGSGGRGGDGGTWLALR
ncbi:MAG: prepilin-type N-terminal cleavage/methylation domain-containing protein [Planctomycetales bacterium]|nr:prepilin-type N-terminal cleavage/methylation domain-containing protein [Planctomycetales bacterium]